MGTTDFSIAAVERDTGLSKDVLRMWERRYGFPRPERDDKGERLYPVEQVERLCQIKRLMDAGYRPGRLMQASDEELSQLALTRTSSDSIPAKSQPLEPLLELIKRHDTVGFHQQMQKLLSREGLLRFVQDTVAPLTERVGQAWIDGDIRVYEEHLYTEQVMRLMRLAISSLPASNGAPRILLTTPPEEQHSIGLLMAEAVLTLEGANCIVLGTQTPLPEIVQAANDSRADVVALSISSAFPSRQVLPLVQQLRALLPPAIELWVGGSAVRRLAPQPEVRALHSLSDAMVALAEWQLGNEAMSRPAG